MSCLARTHSPYQLQAAIAPCHARAIVAAETDWTRIANLYARLIAVTGSPIVRLNHAVAVGMAAGPAAGLALVDAMMSEGALDPYHYAPSVRGDLLEKLGRHSEARAEFERTARLTKNARERDLLEARAQACGPAHRLKRREDPLMAEPATFALIPIGYVRSALVCLRDAPKQGREGGPEAEIDVLPQFVPALHGLAAGQDLLLLTWLHQADRSTLETHPRDDRRRPLAGVFATRSPDRPNPIGLHRVRLLAIADGGRLRVADLEAIDGTPVVDLKPALDER